MSSSRINCSPQSSPKTKTCNQDSRCSIDLSRTCSPWTNCSSVIKTNRLFKHRWRGLASIMHLKTMEMGRIFHQSPFPWVTFWRIQIMTIFESETSVVLAKEIYRWETHRASWLIVGFKKKSKRGSAICKILWISPKSTKEWPMHFFKTRLSKSRVRLRPLVNNPGRIRMLWDQLELLGCKYQHLVVIPSSICSNSKKYLKKLNRSLIKQIS